MATIDPVIVKIQADVSDLKAGLTRAEASLKGLDDNVKKTSGAFGAFGDGVKTLGKVMGAVFATTQVVQFFRESIQQANEAQAAQTRLAELLRNTAGATELQIAALDKQAEALSKVGIASKDNITITQSQLATFDLNAKTINTLTPAILDYVAAEKGATASSDDYKQMTNGLAQALQGNFAALTRVGFVLDEDTKKKISNGTETERSAAIVEVLNSTYKDFNKIIAETPEGRMIKLKQEFDNLKQTLGEALMPILTQVMAFLNTTVLPTLTKGAEFVKKLTAGFGGSGGLSENVEKAKEAIVIFFKPFVELIKKVAGPDSLADRFKALADNIKSFIIPIFNALKDAFMTVRKAILDNQDRIVNLLTIFKELFNWANKYIVPLFRTVLVAAVQSAAKGISAAINLIIPVVEFVAGAIKTLMNVAIKGINFLIAGYNKAAKLLGKDTIPTLDEIGKKTEDFSVKMGRVGNAAKAAGKDVKDAFGGDPFAGGGGGGKGGGKGGLTEDQQKKLEGYKKRVKDIYKDMNDVIAEANEKAKDALDRRNERMLEAEQRFADTKKDLIERRDEQLAAAQERYDETVADLKDRRRKAEEAATKKHTEAVIAINNEYRKRDLELQKARDNKLADLDLAAQRKREDILAKGAEKLAGIVEKSRQRLRDAFAKGTEFKLEDLFGAAKESGGTIVDAIKKQLTQTKDLQKGAGDLAGAGFSQKFIEQIVQAGPTAGLTMIDQIKKLSPEQQKEVQKMYAELDKINETGMDTIANSLSTSTNLATTELQRMYKETQDDIATALKEIDADLKVNIAEAKSAYDAALAEAGTLRDEKLAEAKKAMDDAIAESAAAYKEALAEADATLKKAQDEAYKTYSKGLADAQEVLRRALLDAQKDYEKAIDEINKSTQKKLDDLMAKLREVAAAMAAISKGSAAGVVSSAPSYTPVVAQPITTKPNTVVTEDGTVVVTPTPSTAQTPVRAVPADGSIASWRAGEELSMAKLTINQNFTQVTADAWDIHEKTLSAIRYGTAITPKPTPISDAKMAKMNKMAL